MKDDFSIEMLNTSTDVSSGQHMVADTAFSVSNDHAESLSNDSFSMNELREGIQYEMENLNDREIAKEIAEENLRKDPSYYKKLSSVRNFIRKTALGLFDIPSSIDGGEVLDFKGIPQNPGLSREMGDGEDTEFFGAKEDVFDAPPASQKEELSKMFENIRKIQMMNKSARVRSQWPGSTGYRVPSNPEGERLIASGMGQSTPRRMQDEVIRWFRQEFEGTRVSESEVKRALISRFGDLTMFKGTPGQPPVGIPENERGVALKNLPKRINMVLKGLAMLFPESFYTETFDEGESMQYTSLEDMIRSGVVTQEQVLSLRNSQDSEGVSYPAEDISKMLGISVSNAEWLSHFISKMRPVHFVPQDRSTMSKRPISKFRFYGETSEIKKIQAIIGLTGVDIDGLWGPKTDKFWTEYLAKKGLPFTDPDSFSDASEALRFISSGSQAKKSLYKRLYLLDGNIIEVKVISIGAEGYVVELSSGKQVTYSAEEVIGKEDISEEEFLASKQTSSGAAGETAGESQKGTGMGSGKLIILKASKKRELLDFYEEQLGSAAEAERAFEIKLRELKGGNFKVLNEVEGPEGRMIAMVDLGSELPADIRYDGIYYGKTNDGREAWIAGALTSKEIRRLNLQRGSVQKRELRRERREDRAGSRFQKRDERARESIRRRENARREARRMQIESLNKIAKS